MSTSPLKSKKISQLPLSLPLEGDEVFLATQDGVTVQVRIDKILELVETGVIPDGSITAEKLTNDPNGLSAIRAKIGAGTGSGGGGGGPAGNLVAVLTDYREAGDTTDMQAVYRAYRAGFRTVMARAGGGLGTGAHLGKYIATGLPFKGQKPGTPANSGNANDYVSSPGNLSLPEDGGAMAGKPMHGLRLIGEGRGKTVWKQVGNFCFNVNTASPLAANNAMDMYFADFTVEGLGDPVATQTGHIFAISGSTNMTWERVEFKSFNSDAVCFWPSPRPEEETHNYSPTFRDCDFDGVNSANRNCISIEDGMFGLITNCRFKNACTNTDAVSVAAIDFEPRDKPFYQCAYWTIENCTFTDINRGGVAYYLNGPDYYQVPTTGFMLRNCRFIRCKRLWDSSGSFDDQFDGIADRSFVEISGNYAEDCGDVRILGMNGMMIHHNYFLRCDIVKFGDQVIKGSRNVLVDDNIFANSKQNVVVLVDDNQQSCSFSRNTLNDCGLQYAVDQPGYVLIARKGEVGVRFNENIINNPKGRLKAGFIMTDQATYGTSGYAEKQSNRLYGMAYSVQDTFNPAAPVSGDRWVFNIGSVYISPSGGLIRFDVTTPGLGLGKFYKVRLDRYVQDVVGANNNQAPNFLFAAYPLQGSVMRVVMLNGGGQSGVFFPNDTKLIIQED